MKGGSEMNTDAVTIKYSEKLIELRKDFYKYALNNLPFDNARKLTLSLNEIINEAVGCSAGQGFEIGYAEALNDVGLENGE